jgi:hypothetical protein
MATDGTVSESAFETHLRRFKRDGCNLLVVGELPPPVRTEVSRRLLGSLTDRRYRLLAFTDGDATEVDERLPPELSDTARARTTVLDRPVAARGNDGANSAHHLESDLVDELDALCALDDAIEPGAVRVAIDSLSPLVEADATVLEPFLDTVTEHVHRLSGMAHYFLPVAYGTRSERAVRHHFDAVVEQRLSSDGTLEERWHLPEQSLTTRWISFE